MAKDWKAYVSGYIDGELRPDEREAFERELERDPDLAAELAAMRAMGEVTGTMKLQEFPDLVWEKYWEGTYNRLERRLGWILFSIGAIVLLAVGLYEFVLELVHDTAEPWWIRGAIGAMCGGLAILLVSVVRERLFSLKKDRYREVKR